MPMPQVEYITDMSLPALPLVNRSYKSSPKMIPDNIYTAMIDKPKGEYKNKRYVNDTYDELVRKNKIRR